MPCARISFTIILLLMAQRLIFPVLVSSNHCPTTKQHLPQAIRRWLFVPFFTTQELLPSGEGTTRKAP